MLNSADYFTKPSKCPEDYDSYASLLKNFELDRKNEDFNSVKCYAFEKGDRKNQAFGPVCIKSCYVVDYIFNGCGCSRIFDDLVEAMDFTVKCINFIKA